MCPFLFFILRVQEVGHVAQLFGRSLESFNLFTQLSLFGLLLTKHLVDILHETASYGTVRFDNYIVNEGSKLRVTGVTFKACVFLQQFGNLPKTTDRRGFFINT